MYLPEVKLRKPISGSHNFKCDACIRMYLDFKVAA